MSEVKVSEFDKLSSKFLQLSVREQVMVFVAGVVVILLLTYTFLLEPTFEKSANLNNQIANAKDQVQNINIQTKALMGDVQADPNIAVRQRIQSLNEEIADLDKKLQSQTSNLVPANQMTAVLENVLLSSKGIKLIELQSITPTPMFFNGASKSDSESKPDLFRHGVNIVLEGKYFEIQSYLEKLEALRWKFYWQKFDYKVEQYPVSRVELEIYTVSTSRAFIGV